MIRNDFTLGLATALTVNLALTSCNPGRGQGATDTASIRRTLIELAGGRGDFAPLTITYDDLHALHGGVQLTIHGNGPIKQHARRVKVGIPKDEVIRDDLARLVAVLVKHDVWIQRAPERQLLPDESRAILRTCYRSNCIEIWERYNQLQETGRIGGVLAVMKEIAWTQTDATNASAWSLEIATSGGYTNRGLGTVRVTSEGEVVVTRVTPCSAMLSEELRPLADALMRARPDTWSASYFQAAPSFLDYRLMLELRMPDGTSARYTTSWNGQDASTRKLPNDLAHVNRAAWAIRNNVVRSCK